MSVVKVIEIIAEGKTIEDAVQNAFNEAKKTVREIRQIDVKHVHANIKDNKIHTYRVNTKISFIVEH